MKKPDIIDHDINNPIEPRPYDSLFGIESHTSKPSQKRGLFDGGFLRLSDDQYQYETANARLIAASPELLAELILIEVQLDIKVNLTDPEMIALMLRRVRAVITKATEPTL